ncbi:hypothetical protein Vretifemale_12034, partial [Volvox reticuliferus]
SSRHQSLSLLGVRQAHSASTCFSPAAGTGFPMRRKQRSHGTRSEDTPALGDGILAPHPALGHQQAMLPESDASASVPSILRGGELLGPCPMPGAFFPLILLLFPRRITTRGVKACAFPLLMLQSPSASSQIPSSDASIPPLSAFPSSSLVLSCCRSCYLSRLRRSRHLRCRLYQCCESWSIAVEKLPLPLVP